MFRDYSGYSPGVRAAFERADQATRQGDDEAAAEEIATALVYGTQQDRDRAAAALRNGGQR